MACTDMAYMVMTYIVMASIAMACIVVLHVCVHTCICLSTHMAMRISRQMSTRKPICMSICMSMRTGMLRRHGISDIDMAYVVMALVSFGAMVSATTAMSGPPTLSTAAMPASSRHKCHYDRSVAMT